MFAFVMDREGWWAYRWLADSEEAANAIWPGLRKYGSDPVLNVTRPLKRPTKLSTPCYKHDPYCLMFHPSASDETACTTAGADGDASSLPGAWAAASNAGMNWWDLFEVTGQNDRYPASIIPKRADLPTTAAKENNKKQSPLT
jgi:hypothetical protein